MQEDILTYSLQVTVIDAEGEKIIRDVLAFFDEFNI